jgi:hypothetical protein
MPEPASATLDAAAFIGGGMVDGGMGASGYRRRLSSLYSGVISRWKNWCSTAAAAVKRKLGSKHKRLLHKS